jgi:hypothetical protein
MKRLLLSVGLVFSTAVVAVGCLGDSASSVESFASKREWSVLQSLESQTRGTKITHPQFRKVEEYEVMAVPSQGDGTPLWILMRAEGHPYYKQMPEGSYVVSEQLVSELAASRRISGGVESALRSRVQPQ